MKHLEIIESVLNNIVESYWAKKKFILTERDLVAQTFSLLQKKSIPNTIIHCELRPFKGPFNDGEKNQYKVIREIEGKAEWCQQVGNSGALFDLCILDSNDDYWQKAYDKARNSRKEPNYWRFPSYPNEAFKAVIEFKIRGRGNIERIISDIKKLALMCTKDGHCHGFLVLLDRCITDDIVKNLQDIFNNPDLTRVTLCGLNSL